MSSCFGRYFRLSLFGQSHGPGVGITLDGFPAGLEIDMEDVARQMARRAPGQSALTTPRKESDLPEILSGVFRGKTTGQPLTCLIRNENTRSQDYGEQVDLPRPGHGDYTGHVRYYGFEDFRGGGHFSARLTAPLVFAGALCRQYLAGQGISAVCHIQQLENILDKSFLDPVEPGDTPAEALPTRTLPTLRPELASQMEAAILAARAAQDSVGGVLECRIDGLPAGLGAPFFDSVESVLSQLMFSIPAVKGIAFGAGFGFASLRGSQANDPFRMEAGKVVTATNHNGGVNGGITNGMPLLFSTAVKPTPSIYQPQATVDLAARENATLQIQGRHDPCIAHRAAAVQDCLTALCLGDLLNQALGLAWQQGAGWPKEAPWNTD